MRTVNRWSRRRWAAPAAGVISLVADGFGAPGAGADPIYEQINVSRAPNWSGGSSALHSSLGLIAFNALAEVILAWAILTLIGRRVRTRRIIAFAICFAPLGLGLDWLSLSRPSVVLSLVTYWLAATLVAAIVSGAILGLRRGLIVFAPLFALATAPYSAVTGVFAEASPYVLQPAVLLLGGAAAIELAGPWRRPGLMRRVTAGVLALALIYGLAVVATASSVQAAFGGGLGRCADNMTYIAGALQRYHREVGAYPRELAELAPRYLPAHRLRCPGVGANRAYTYRPDTKDGYPLLECRDRHWDSPAPAVGWGYNRHRIIFFAHSLFDKSPSLYDVCTSDRYSEEEFLRE